MSRFDDPNAGPPWWGHDIRLSLVNPNDPINFGLPGNLILAQDPTVGGATQQLTVVNWTVSDIQANLPAYPPFDGPYALTLGLPVACLNPTNPIGGIYLDPAQYGAALDIKMREDANFALTPFILLPGATVQVDMYAWGTIWAGVLLTGWNPSVGWLNYDAHESKFLLHGQAGKVDRPHPYGLMYGLISLGDHYFSDLVQTPPGMVNQILAAPLNWAFPNDVISRNASLRTNGFINWRWGDPSVDPADSRGTKSDPASGPQVDNPNLYSDIHHTGNESNQFLLVLGINDDAVGNGKGNFAVNVRVQSGNVVYIPNVPRDPPWVPAASPLDWIRELPLRRTH